MRLRPPLPIRLWAWIVVSLVPIAHASVESRTTHLVERFDEQVIRGEYPAVVVETEPARRTKRSAAASHAQPDSLVVHAKLNVSVIFPGEVTGHMYRGELDGKAATFTRYGDRLDVTMPVHGGIEVTVFTVGNAHVTHTRFDDADDAPRLDERADSLTRIDPPYRSKRSLTNVKDLARPPLNIHLFTHVDVETYLTREEIHARYLAWWLSDIAEALPTLQINLRYLPPLHGITNLAYTGDAVLQRWTASARAWAKREDIAFEDSNMNKFLLLTLPQPIEGSSGLAWQDGNAAVASVLGRYRIVGHELGHLLGAVHGDAEVRYESGWWCETNMYATASIFRSNCYAYSQANKRNLRAYLLGVPGTIHRAHAGPSILD